jgi:feruloyl-CoA synthase
VIEHVKLGLQDHNRHHPNPAARIARVLLQPIPPRADAGEITEKGYINQSRTQDLRKADVEKLYAAAPAPDIIDLKR